MKIIFMGSPDFAVPVLDALHQAGHRVIEVFCQPDKPAGRGLKMQAVPVKKRAEALGIPVRQPVKLRDPAIVAGLASLAPDVIAVAAYGKILPKSVLDVPRLGCINVHASLLPRWRGASPIHRAILAGDSVTGVTIMRMDEGMDTGDMLLGGELPIEPSDTVGTLHDKLAVLGARLLVEALERLERGDLPPTPQDHSQATLAPKLEDGIGLIDFSRTVAEVDRLVRGLSPFPGAYTFLKGRRLKILEARPAAGTAGGPAGEVVRTDGKSGFTVACGEGALLIVRLQPEGGRPMAGGQFVGGRCVNPGDRLEGPPPAAPVADPQGER